MIEPKTQVENDNVEFYPAEEKAIISLLFDEPEFMSGLMQLIKSEYFSNAEAQYVYGLLQQDWNKNHVLLNRELAKIVIHERLTVDDPWTEIEALIDYKLTYNERIMYRSRIADWAIRCQYAKLYSEEAIKLHQEGEYSYHEMVIEEARKITDQSLKGFNFFHQYHELFNVLKEDHFTCGFPSLDRFLNEGGPVRGEVFCWMGPTGTGKSIALVNSGTANVFSSRKVLHITLEMPVEGIAQRYMGNFTNEIIKERRERSSEITSKLEKMRKSYGENLMIMFFPPEEITTDTIRSILDSLRRTNNFNADVVIIDYLELMKSREIEGDKEYGRQKKVATDMANLAGIENVLVLTASQTNRAGMSGQSEAQDIDLDKTAESFGKNMPLGYVVTLNQTKEEYEGGTNDDDQVRNAKMRFYIAKNRNGPKFKQVTVTVDYETMRMREGEPNDFGSNGLREKDKDEKKRHSRDDKHIKATEEARKKHER